MFYIHLIDENISQVRPEGYIHPDDVYKESSRAAGGRQKSSKGASRAAVSLLIWTEWLI